LSAGAVLLAWCAQALIGPQFGDVFAFAPFVVSAMFAAWIGGLGSALFALVAGYLIIASFYASPDGLLDKDHLAALTIYLFFGGSSATLAELLHRARRRAEATTDGLRVTLYSIAEAVIVTGASGRITALNPVAEALTGWAQSDALDRGLDEVFETREAASPRSSIAGLLPAPAGQSPSAVSTRTTLVRKDGKMLPIDASSAPIIDHYGAVAGNVIVFRDVTERRRHERALEESEERFRQLAEHIRKVFWMMDPHSGEILYASPSYEDVWGRSVETLYQQPQSYFDAIHPDDQLRVDSASVKPQRRGEPTEIEYRIVRPDQSIRWVRDWSFPIRDPSGRLYRTVGFAEDITERRRIEEAVRENEERLRLALDAGQIGVWDWDVETNKLRWTKRIYEIHGVAPDKFTGDLADFRCLIHPDDADRVTSAIQGALAGADYNIEFRIVRPSGETRWLFTSGRVLHDENGKPLRMLGATIDTTDRKRAEEVLRFLSEASTAMAAVLDEKTAMQSLVRLAVPFFADYCTVELANELRQFECVALAHVDSNQEQLLRELTCAKEPQWATDRVVQSGRTEHQEFLPPDAPYWTANDERRRTLKELAPQSVVAAPLLSRGNVIGVLSLYFSSSSRRRYLKSDVSIAEEIARRAAIAVENARLYQSLKEADRQKDDFLAMLAHELRNPLAAIEYAAALMRMSAEQGPKATEIIERQVRHLAHLIDDLLDVSRITRDQIQLQREPIDAALLVRRAVDTAIPSLEKRSHRLALEVAAGPLPIFADPTRIEQILGNLLTNAAKYTPDGGEISVRTYAKDEQLIVKVKDSGVGIPPEMLSRVFELFTQVNPTLDRSQGGLGIGLTVVRRLAEMHGGSISATSEGLGKGSEFTLRLPLLNGELAQAVSNGVSANIPHGLRVLIVEDNRDTASSLSSLLRSAGCETQVVNDGPAAVHTAIRFSPSVVLLDIGLPGLDGFAIAQEMRNRPELCRATLIAISGYSQPQDRARAKAVGFDHHLIKPVKFECVLDLLAQCAAHHDVARNGEKP
jgi:PAS domain S-box-containing protein